MTDVETYSANLTIFHTQSHADKHLPVTPARDKFIFMDSYTEFYHYSEETHRTTVRNVSLFVVDADSNLFFPLVSLEAMFHFGIEKFLFER